MPDSSRGGLMDVQFSLAVADIRLLQTWHLLRRTMDDHQDEKAIANALESIRAARDIIANLRNS